MALTIKPVRPGTNMEFPLELSALVHTGDYVITITDITDSDRPTYEDRTKREPCYALFFEIEGLADGNGEKVRGSYKISNKLGGNKPSTLDKIIAATLGKSAIEQIAESADTAALLNMKGRKLKSYISLETSDRGTKFNKIVNFSENSSTVSGIVQQNVSLDDDELPFGDSAEINL